MLFTKKNDVFDDINLQENDLLRLTFFLYRTEEYYNKRKHKFSIFYETMN